MKATNKWDPPGWPWELELLALFFVVAAIVVPMVLGTASDEVSAGREMQLRMESVFWSLAIVGVYVAHLIVANASLDLLSTSFTHLFSPLLFAMVAYYRLYASGQTQPVIDRVVHGDALEALTWIALVLIATFVVARLRMARHLLRFRGTTWEVTAPAPVDATFFKLALHFHPLVYWPRTYRACSEGLLITGWVYVMPIPFRSIDAMSVLRSADVASAGLFLATTERELLAVALVEQKQPVIISPRNREAFLSYCEDRLTPETPAPLTQAGPKA